MKIWPSHSLADCNSHSGYSNVLDTEKKIIKSIPHYIVTSDLAHLSD